MSKRLILGRLAAAMVLTGAALMARSAEGGSISGRVTAADGTTPLENIEVYAYRCWLWENWECENFAYTDANGNYEVGELSDGTYRIEFVDYFTGHFSEYYNNAQSFYEATDIPVGESATMSGIDALMEEYATVSGVVTEALGGAPVAGARVYLHGTQLSAVTDSTGSYTIRYVLPGTYALHANPDASTGLLGAWHGGALYAEQRTPPDGSVMVSAASGQSVSGVDFALPRGARIAGTILGNGLPLAGAQVKVFGADGRLAYRTHSGAEGQYALSPLLPATYRVKVLADGFADLWWNSADNAVGAANLTMGLGDEATLDFDLAKGQSPALVQVTSDPPGAEIYLDFHPTGEVTPAMIDVGEVGAWDAHGHWPASHVIPLNGPASHVIPLNRLASHVITLKRAGSPQPSPRCAGRCLVSDPATAGPAGIESRR